MPKDKHHSKVNNNDQNIDFASVMAVAVHDMKNSLSLLLQTIEDLSKSLPPSENESREHIVDLHYEASRMNTTLVQILSLYRVELDALPLNIDECFMEDLVYEVIESNKTYTKQKNITCSVDVDGELSWFTDKDLLFLLLNDVLVNAIRYGASEIKISTLVEDGYLCITVEDNGPGYPQRMLDMSDAAMESLCVSEGRTGLGLFFARMIAQTHKNKNRQGSIKLSNNSVTGGSIFKVLLP
ncbi:sensor histidine kinase [Glaciecola sp. MF2-115]|uniref:sensor histidine kinase n=1 Tax=Glaciecola sp. MF2-115 TaxID=3384827 RepID=UPI00399FDE35